MKTLHFSITVSMLLATLAFCPPLAGQPANPAPAPASGVNTVRRPQAPQIVSPEVTADRHVTFRIRAPQAQLVKLNGGDIPSGSKAEFTKGTNDVWEATIGPVDPGAYRYTFNVDGTAVVDPRSSSISESMSSIWSMVVVPGSDLFDSKPVPHGAVASITYSSKALGKDRRMHVYTPPGYEKGNQSYPTFYLLHGSGDCDEAWTSVGRAGFILDNLIASGKAKPMVVVMPAGHVSAIGGGLQRPAAGRSTDDFTEDFVKDIMPYVEKNYRVLADRPHRAIAGLSMGGSQTLNIAIPHLDQFAYIGVFSSGLLGSRNQNSETAFGASWVTQNQAMIDNKELKPGLKLFWFGIGKDDFLLATSKSTVELLKKHEFNIVNVETAGGHTWINWRNYLGEFAPQLFQ